MQPLRVKLTCAIKIRLFPEWSRSRVAIGFSAKKRPI